MQTEYQRLYYLKNKDKIKKRHKEWRMINKERISERMRKYNATPEIRNRRIKTSKTFRENTRNKIFGILGHVCIKCGFSDKRALQFDHINGGGNRERKSYKGGQDLMNFYSKNPELTKQKLQVLCANCNWIKKHVEHEHRISTTK